MCVRIIKGDLQVIPLCTRAYESSLQNSRSRATCMAINNRTGPRTFIASYDLWRTTRGGQPDEEEETRWSRNHFCWPEKLCVRVFFFLILFARFISPNRFSTDSSETARIFALTSSMYKYDSGVLFFFSINSRGGTISAEIPSRRFIAIFYSEDWKVTDMDGGRAFAFLLFFSLQS